MMAVVVAVVGCDFSFPTEKTPSSFASNCRCWPLLILNEYKEIISLKKHHASNWWPIFLFSIKSFGAQSPGGWRIRSVDCLSLRPVVKRRENPFPFDCGLPRSIVRTSAVFVTINSEADRWFDEHSIRID